MNKNNKKALLAILFVAGNPVTTAELSKFLEISEEEVDSEIEAVRTELEQFGLVITKMGSSYQMATAPEVSTVVKNFSQSQLREKLTEAAIETLAIVAYKQPVSRAEIESIRGVNSQYILKLLLQRGLVEKIPSKNDARVLLYQTTHEFLQHLGIKDTKELPSFEEIEKKLETPEIKPET